MYILCLYPLILIPIKIGRKIHYTLRVTVIQENFITKKSAIHTSQSSTAFTPAYTSIYRTLI